MVERFKIILSDSDHPLTEGSLDNVIYDLAHNEVCGQIKGVLVYKDGEILYPCESLQECRAFLLGLSEKGYIKTFKDFKEGDKLWLFWGLQQITEATITRMQLFKNGYDITVKLESGEVHNLYPRFKPDSTFGGNYYTTRKGAQEARNINLSEEITRLQNNMADLDAQIEEYQNQIID